MSNITAGGITSVLFTLGLIYSGLLLVTFYRTYERVFLPGHRDDLQKVFMAFYISIWITLGLTITLYFMLCTAALKQHATANFGALILYFVPFILILLCYILIYHQCEALMVESRIQQSEQLTA